MQIGLNVCQSGLKIPGNDEILKSYIRINDMSDLEKTNSEDSLVLDESRSKLNVPPMYKVIIHNDDYTPMEFVVQILERFFSMNREKATQIMIHVHTQGKGLCGVFTRDVAETKVALVNEYSRTHQHPLLCAMETA